MTDRGSAVGVADRTLGSVAIVAESALRVHELVSVGVALVEHVRRVRGRESGCDAVSAISVLRRQHHVGEALLKRYRVGDHDLACVGDASGQRCAGRRLGAGIARHERHLIGVDQPWVGVGRRGNAAYGR